MKDNGDDGGVSVCEDGNEKDCYFVETSPSPPKLPELREVVPESDIVN